MNELIQKMIDTAPVFREILGLDVAISISDMEKYLYILDTDLLKFPCEVGTSVNQAGYDQVLNQIKKSRKPFVNFVPREVTGTVPIKAVISPIFDRNEMVGLFSMSMNIENESRLENISESLTKSIDSTSESMDSVAVAAKELTSMMQSIENNAVNAEESLKLGSESIKLIKGIATQSGLLGLNAAIEASRSGEQGKGFSVVASEMRKLANQSKETAEQVINALSKIEESVNSVLNEIKAARDVSNKQYDSTSMINENIKAIADTSSELVSLSKKIEGI